MISEPSDVKAGGPPAGQPVRWHLVIPVKDGTIAKSRLHPPPPLARPDLARAVALDTIESACAALPPRQVTVVTSDPSVTASATALGASVVPDPGRGLNVAISTGWARPGDARAGASADRESSDSLGWAALLGDLPALRPSDLRTALDACSAYPSALVPDAAGSGTVLLASLLAPPRPQFGTGSAARHARTATVLALDLPRLRQDVDTVEELRAALALGVGRHTQVALRRAS